MTPETNPYVGPRPFETGDADIFFGRTREIRDLASLVVAHRVVLLYSASGAGKSSLINAGVAPVLAERGFQVLPSARVSTPTETDDADNVYAKSLIAGWAGQESTPRASLTEFLRGMPRSLDEDGQPVRRLAVIDQFEELFTAYPERWNERPGRTSHRSRH